MSSMNWKRFKQWAKDKYISEYTDAVLGKGPMPAPLIYISKEEQAELESLKAPIQLLAYAFTEARDAVSRMSTAERSAFMHLSSKDKLALLEQPVIDFTKPVHVKAMAKCRAIIRRKYGKKSTPNKEAKC